MSSIRRCSCRAELKAILLSYDAAWMGHMRSPAQASCIRRALNFLYNQACHSFREEESNVLRRRRGYGTVSADKRI